jgi:hypothetical protein
MQDQEIEKPFLAKVVGLNPAVYWMDVSDLLAITIKKIN